MPTKEELKQIRIDAGLTQAQLASLFGLSSQNYISKYESGLRIPSNQTYLLYKLLATGKIKLPKENKK